MVESGAPGLLANDEFRLFFHDLHGDSRVGSEEHQRVTRETGNGFRGIHVVAATIVGVALFYETGDFFIHFAHVLETPITISF